MMPSCLREIASGVLAERLASDLRTNASALDAFRPGTGLRVRVEAVLKHGRMVRSEEYKHTFLAGMGYAAYRLAERTEQEWKDAWIAQPGWLF